MIKQIFTWWHRETFGTFLKTLFLGKFVGNDAQGNRYYKSKKNERWVVYANNIDASKIDSDWFLWMHHTVNNIPNKDEKKHLWQKEHSENLTGTNKAYKPNKISKLSKKNMKLGKFKNFIIIFLCLTSVNLKSEDKITTIPLINLDDLKPSYEDVSNENIVQGNNNFEIKKKRKHKHLIIT